MRYEERDRAVLSGLFSHAAIDTPVEIGEGTQIWHYTHVMDGAKIGDKCTIGQGVHVAPGVVVGNGCAIQNGVQLFTGVTLEDDVFVGPCVVFTNVLTPRAFVSRKNDFRPTLVKRGASIGANATIVCGVTIGEYAMVGAGAVVTGDVLAYTLVVGNPARMHRFVCRCGGLLPILPIRAMRFEDKNVLCGYCDTVYEYDPSTTGIRPR
ncbi:MAG: N-acetyltransferase [Candidatus Eremiobacteraeota bacterium]|nr:N-acetyltransferase [Candidatus Eremiobacteraeota bacterium]